MRYSTVPPLRFLDVPERKLAGCRQMRHTGVQEFTCVSCLQRVGECGVYHASLSFTERDGNPELFQILFQGFPPQIDLT